MKIPRRVCVCRRRLGRYVSILRAPLDLLLPRHPPQPFFPQANCSKRERGGGGSICRLSGEKSFPSFLKGFTQSRIDHATRIQKVGGGRKETKPLGILSLCAVVLLLVGNSTFSKEEGGWSATSSSPRSFVRRNRIRATLLRGNWRGGGVEGT